MKTADLAKADELNKANAEFQTKCSSYPPNPTVAAASPVPPAPTPATHEGGEQGETARSGAEARCRRDSRRRTTGCSSPNRRLNPERGRV